MQLPKLVDSHKLRSEAQRVLTRSRQGRRQPAEAVPGESELVAALLTWSQAVCGAHGLAIHNFRTSFADARGLCWLVSSPDTIIAMTPLDKQALISASSCERQADIGGQFKHVGAERCGEMVQLTVLMV